MSNLSSRDLLAELVAFPTVSRDSNLALIEFVRDYLNTLGVACELDYNAQRSKANLYATIGPMDRGGVLLSGHSDVVPVDGQAWTLPPFELSERDGKLYGRGTADMKGFIACVLAAVPRFLAQPLRLPVHLAFSYDEEVGCLGVRSLLAELQRRPHKPLLCLIGEPTELKPVLGHKGKLAMRCQVQGAACHSAYAPQGVNAIEYAARLIGRLGEIGARLAVPERHDRRFDPPYSTVQTGLIQGGRALNEEVYDEAVAIAARVARETALGDPLEKGDHLGPVVSKAHFDKIQDSHFAPAFVAKNFELRRGQIGGQTKGEDRGATVRRWARLTEPHDLDPAAKLVLMGDVMPPGAMRAMQRQGPISSINWSFNVLDPASQSRGGWYLAENASQHADAGYSSERLRMWDVDGKQVLDGLQSVAVFG